MAAASPASKPSPPTAPSTPRSPTSPLHLDLSTLPPPLTPSPPSNTLLITNLQDPAIFTAPFLQQLRELLAEQAPLHSFAPLKSFRRVVVSFYDVDAATAVRAALDGATLLGHRVRVYFGEPTPTDAAAAAVRHLAAPEADRLFFISPPPSPPAGWSMRNEDPPNKAVHAEDLASALAKLHARPGADAAPTDAREPEGAGAPRKGSSTVVYRPDDHGGSPGLPAVMVEDTTKEPGQADTEMPDARLQGMTHTARPPLEEMDVS